MTMDESQRSAAAKKAQASRTPEQRSASAKKAIATMRKNGTLPPFAEPDHEEIVVERREVIGCVEMDPTGTGSGPFEAAMTMLGKYLDDPSEVPVGIFQFTHRGITVSIASYEEGA